MTISKELLDDILKTVEDERLRNNLAEALTRESTELSDVRNMIWDLSAYLKEVDLDELRRARADTLRRELQDLDSEMGRLTMNLYELTERVDSLISPRRSTR